MSKFGVIELAGTRTTAAPGWAYVPNTVPGPASAVTQSSNRKRARNAPGGNLSMGDLSVRQEAKIRKEVEALERDGAKDNSIPLPVKGGRANVKYTPNVRKIMQSQKTFANHVDDFLALQALAESNPGAPGSISKPGGASSSIGKRPPPGKKDTPQPTPKDEDLSTIEVDTLPPALPAPCMPQAVAHPGDNDPLLMSRVPEMPSDAELRKLLAHPPLTCLENQGVWDQTYPTRVFCQVCGYWGRVRCMKCGTRVCALDCLDAHKEECVTRYGM
ncbi:hypothetical protein RJ55_07819 [Drechmeria coniospora]|nr:hypothetical protein RJ55_07819 [Drechmeria coniospora]